MHEGITGNINVIIIFINFVPDNSVVSIQFVKCGLLQKITLNKELHTMRVVMTVIYALDSQVRFQTLT